MENRELTPVPELPEEEKEAAPAGELKFFSREELAEVLERWKKQGGSADREEEIVARASAVRLLRENRVVLWESKSQPGRRWKEMVEDVLIDNQQLEEKHRSRLYTLLADPNAASLEEQQRSGKKNFDQLWQELVRGETTKEGSAKLETKEPAGVGRGWIEEMRQRGKKLNRASGKGLDF